VGPHGQTERHPIINEKPMKNGDMFLVIRMRHGNSGTKGAIQGEPVPCGRGLWVVMCDMKNVIEEPTLKCESQHHVTASPFDM